MEEKLKDTRSWITEKLIKSKRRDTKLTLNGTLCEAMIVLKDWLIVKKLSADFDS